MALFYGAIHYLEWILHCTWLSLDLCTCVYPVHIVAQVSDSTATFAGDRGEIQARMLITMSDNLTVAGMQLPLVLRLVVAVA